MRTLECRRTLPVCWRQQAIIMPGWWRWMFHKAHSILSLKIIYIHLKWSSVCIFVFVFFFEFTRIMFRWIFGFSYQRVISVVSPTLAQVPCQKIAYYVVHVRPPRTDRRKYRRSRSRCATDLWEFHKFFALPGVLFFRLCCDDNHWENTMLLVPGYRYGVFQPFWPDNIQKWCDVVKSRWFFYVVDISIKYECGVSIKRKLNRKFSVAPPLTFISAAKSSISTWLPILSNQMFL